MGRDSPGDPARTYLAGSCSISCTGIRVTRWARPVDWAGRGYQSALAPAAFAVFVAMGVASSAGLTRKTNLSARRRVDPRKNKTATRIATELSHLGAPYARPIVAGGLALACWLLGTERPSRIVAAAAGATLLEKASRLALHQRRPPGAGVHHGLDVYAYPSGHCSSVAAMMTAAAREISRGQTPRVRNSLTALAVAASLATAWSRLYLDEHWMDDVIGGLSAGFGLGRTVTEP